MMPTTIRAAVVALTLAWGVEARLHADETKPAAGLPSLQPLVVIGASASAGFILAEPFGGPKTPQYQLSRYLDAALIKPGRAATNLASTSFFLNPDVEAKRQIDGALELKPGTVVAVDFMFWFCYGRAVSEEERPARFERGLALLDRLKCPMLVGDIPDASAAVGGMLSQAEMPSAETIGAANRRLVEWAKGRANTAVLSLSNFMSCCQADRSLTVHQRTWADGETRKLLQADKLHPARHGCAALALAIMDALVTKAGVILESEVRWDADDIYRRVTETPGAAAKSDSAVEPKPPSGT